MISADTSLAVSRRLSGFSNNLGVPLPITESRFVHRLLEELVRGGGMGLSITQVDACADRSFAENPAAACVLPVRVALVYPGGRGGRVRTRDPNPSQRTIAALSLQRTVNS